MSKIAPKRRGLIDLIESHSELFEPGEEGCSDNEIHEIEHEIGQDLPRDIVELLKVSDGGVLHGAHEVLHLASCAQLRVWHLDGVMEDLDVFPFGHNGSDTLVLVDDNGTWGATSGSVYRLEIGRRSIGGYPIQDASLVASSVYNFFDQLMSGKDVF
jgi:hypothetical protein